MINEIENLFMLSVRALLMSFDQNLLQMVFQKKCETRNLRVFFGSIFAACWIRT